VRARQTGLPIFDCRLTIGAQSKIAGRQSAILGSSVVSRYCFFTGGFIPPHVQPMSGQQLLPIFDCRLMIGAQSEIVNRQSAILGSSVVSRYCFFTGGFIPPHVQHDE
jgi:hypothetical protein